MSRPVRTWGRAAAKLFILEAVDQAPDWARGAVRYTIGHRPC